VNLFNFSQEEMLSFFAVLIRFSVLFAVLPFVGDNVIPAPVKVLLALATSIALFPALISTGAVHPAQAGHWGSTTGGIVGTISMEVVLGLLMGFTARMAFESIQFGGNLVGNFMGFAAASTYDPHQEGQTQVVAQIQTVMAMLIFLAVDGHHLMLRAALDSYQVVGIGGGGFLSKTGVNAAISARLIDLSGQVVRFGIQLAAPVAVSLFAVNVAFGVMAKTMPQLNILVLSFAVSALVGLLVMLMSVPEFQGASASILGRTGEWIDMVLLAVAGR
jgi:flagellar biosynthetic protein FliR